jgi:hypothetical protein
MDLGFYIIGFGNWAFTSLTFMGNAMLGWRTYDEGSKRYL